MIKFYNTLTRKKEEFISLEKNKVKIYSCGPTVYSYQHIGNMRAAIFVDVTKRVLRYFNYQVIDVLNITDVGHLVSDEDAGEDKMLKAAKKENKNPYEIARFYEDAYINDLKLLNIILPKYMPRATEHIAEQIDLIKDLEKNKFTYKISDGIYFDVSKFKEYGKLSGQSLEEKKAGARVEVKSEKKNQADFALWKFLTGDNKNHVMKWDSPWGVGFPGWHLECSAMSHKYLGDEFDIHTGGIDHVPVHHENEIAQNVCSGEIKRVNYWLHNAHLLVDNEKISKSLGNGYVLSDLIGKGLSPLAFRELCLRSHYRKQVNFSFESLDAGQSNVKKINDFYNKVLIMKANEEANDLIKPIFNKRLDDFEEALKDDMNTSVAIASVYEFISDVNKKSILSENDIKLSKEFIERTDKVLGLLEKKVEISKEIIEIARKRKAARDKKDFKESDRLRDELKKLGFEIKDSNDVKEGYILNKA